MALHIRDFRQNDAAGLSGLCATGRHIGALPAQDAKARILCGLREDSLTAAIWLSLEDDTGIIPAIITARTATWQSDAAELIAEASLWLTSRGAALIELNVIPTDTELHAALLDMNFQPDERAGVFRRLVPARSDA